MKRSTGTSDPRRAERIEAMLEELGPRGRRDFELLEAVAANQVRLADLFAAWERREFGDLQVLRARLADVDLTGQIEAWQLWLADRVASDTRQHYLRHVRALMPFGSAFVRSDFTSSRIAQWLAALPRKGPTKRKYLEAVRSFGAYLKAIGLLAANPVRDVDAPPPGKPRTAFLELPDVQRVVDAAIEPYRSLFALCYGAGVEISAALRIRRRDVDSSTREIRAPGTKAWNRDRTVLVADWAWPVVLEAVTARLPHALLWPKVDRWQAGEYHRQVTEVLQLTGYRLHDARRHWAVRAVRAGTPLQHVAEQLGHNSVQMVAKVYGRYVPKREERAKWEAIAAAMDEQALREASRGAVVVQLPVVKVIPTAKSLRRNSRGGTRTRDPGIMSAVL